MNKHNSVISVLFSKPFLGILILFTVVSLLNIPVLITLWRHGFDDGTYSHAFLIPFISLYLYFLLAETGKLQFRKELAIAPTISLVLSCYLLFVTANAQISVGYWGALLAVFIISVTMLYRFNWYIVFPAAFLIFIFPFWGILVPVLQNISVVAVTYMMSFTGVPTYVEAEIITIPAGVFEIAGGCSGLRYMIVSLAIGSLFIFLNIRDTKKAVLFLSLTILGALLTNWIRITALILIGEYTNMESSLMEDHNTFGWYLYVPFMILLFYWGNHLAYNNPPIQRTEKLKGIQIPEKMNFLVLLSVLIVSSTMLKQNILAVFNPEELTKHALSITNDQDVKPDVYYYSSVEKEVIKENFTQEYYIYHYHGIDLDGKPSFYNNNFIPSGWSVTEELIKNNWAIYSLIKNNETAIVSIQYQIDNYKTAHEREFKLMRLLKAVKGITSTELHWKFALCTKTCHKLIDISL